MDTRSDKDVSEQEQVAQVFSMPGWRAIEEFIVNDATKHRRKLLFTKTKEIDAAESRGAFTALRDLTRKIYEAGDILPPPRIAGLFE